MIHTPDDRLLEALRRLPAVEADAAHDARVRRRCHEALAERRRGPSYRLRHTRRRLESALVGAFGVVYLVAIFYDVIQIYRP